MYILNQDKIWCLKFKHFYDKYILITILALLLCQCAICIIYDEAFIK